MLYSFGGGADGLAPLGALTMKGRVLYGTAMSGGYGCDIYGCGTVFSLTPPAKGSTAWAFKALYAFKGGADGGVPQAGLYVSSSGALYGTTFQFGDTGVDCGRFIGCGTVFKISPPAKGSTMWRQWRPELGRPGIRRRRAIRHGGIGWRSRLSIGHRTDLRRRGV